MIHNPEIFFKKRIVPYTPPSFVKLCWRDFSVMIGSFTSIPIKDHVPLLINTLFSDSSGAAHTAEAVS